MLQSCDFNTLTAGVPLTDASQTLALEADCLLSVSVSDTVDNNVLNIFDSSNILSDNNKNDPDLGTPNRACPGGGPGKGTGGKPDAAFPNCEPEGNLLIIQNESIDPSEPNDSAYGGCILFEFVQPVTLLDFGVMDIDEAMNVETTLTDASGDVFSFPSPENIGDNGHWKVATTMDLSTFADVVSMKVCLPGSGAISFIDVSTCDV